MRKLILLSAITLLAIASVNGQSSQPARPSEGSLFAVSKKGETLGNCPLKKTAVQAEISGPFARVDVRQEFRNEFSETIEAVYSFPLSQRGAVDDMTMRIGERVIRGRMMRAEEARAVYDTAKREGKSASLLEQARPNIFTQSVANILPGETIVIEISYVETLSFENNSYEFVFPMTIGPRYVPVTTASKQAPPTPPVAETRPGSDVSIEVKINAAVPIEKIESKSHPISLENLSGSGGTVTLKDETAIPNKDFVLRFDVAVKALADAVLTHKSSDRGFFQIILQPPGQPRVQDITPKEIVFVIDTSGSMDGFPIEKAKEAVRLSLEGLNPNDTFNVISFAGETSVLFDAPVVASPENLAMAKRFIDEKHSGGGTEMMKAIRAAFKPTESEKHLRIVCFLTDGFVGNEDEILAEIKNNRNARVFSFGIGGSVNRFLLDKMAEEGHGEVEYVSLNDDGSAAAKRFFERIRSPLLTDLAIDWNGIKVEDVYPKRVGDLFSSKPIIITGRYEKGQAGEILLKGNLAGTEYVRRIPVLLPDNEPANEVLVPVWARREIDSLSSAALATMNEAERNTLRERIIKLSLEYRVLTNYTAFVAVEETIVNRDGKPVRVDVPILLPEGTKQPDSTFSKLTIIANLQRPPASVRPEPMGGGFVTDGSARANNDSRNTLLTVPGAGLTTPAAPEPKPADQPTTADEALKRLRDFQKSLKSVRASVRSTETIKADTPPEISEGTMIVVPRDRSIALRIDWTSPKKETIAVVGGKYVVYRPDEKRAMTGSVDPNSKNALLLAFTLGQDDLGKAYDVKYLGEEVLENGVNASRIELTAKSAGDYKTIEIWIDSQGAVVRTRAVRTIGGSLDVLFSNTQVNVPIEKSEFAVTLEPGTEIIKN